MHVLNICISEETPTQQKLPHEEEMGTKGCEIMECMADVQHPLVALVDTADLQHRIQHILEQVVHQITIEIREDHLLIGNQEK